MKNNQVKRKAGRPKGSGNKSKPPEYRSHGRNLTIPPSINNLLMQESIIRGLSVNGLINEILYQHVTHDSLQLRYLRAIITTITKSKTSAKIIEEVLKLNDYDKMIISQLEIEASKFSRKKRKIPKIKTVEPIQEKVNIFDLDTLKKPT